MPVDSHIPAFWSNCLKHDPARSRHLRGMARVAALGQDLMLASRVRTALDAAGHEVEPDTTLPDELDGVDLVDADLDAVLAEQLAALGLPVVGLCRDDN